jgi:CTP synthase
MQMMVIEFARNVLGYKDANSAEMRPTPQQTHPQPLPVMEGSNYQDPVNVIDLMEEQKNITQMGGTMRLGAYDCKVLKGSKSFDAYSQSELSTPLHNREGQGEGLLIKERHRHRYEFNNRYKEEYEKAGMRCVGINPAANLVEIVEITDKRWYIGTQFHPEYSSTVLQPHPLFMSFIKACM